MLFSSAVHSLHCLIFKGMQAVYLHLCDLMSLNNWWTGQALLPFAGKAWNGNRFLRSITPRFQRLVQINKFRSGVFVFGFPDENKWWDMILMEENSQRAAYYCWISSSRCFEPVFSFPHLSFSQMLCHVTDCFSLQSVSVLT